ncbi:WYL domain-containing protein [Ferribacterium limneticum]|uniref:WYL domain-containing protein n=1 Tax=Ferribacterium limneticum TaxID=76259 RepID=UPI001CFB3702|nr:WYL domain-containing protein [Ferribacterium limneticum]UCV28135.1 WYL domain-containing protein [Ferribacterium limneticum]UCV32052.1 WYL domain-containing protein [Ferribacterium limneticum]
MAPQNLSYDIAEKCFRPTKQFKPIFAIDNPANLLTTIAATAWLPDQERGRLLGFALPVDGMPPFAVAIDRELLAAICRCITGETALQVSYQSLTTPEPVSRYFVPHALIFTGLRWLVRGWDGRHKAYRDLALARFVSARETSTFERGPRDEDWFELVSLHIATAKGLSCGQAEVTAREYGMKPDGDGGYLVELKLRRAVLPYVLDYLRLRPSDAFAAASPICLRNYSDVAEFDRGYKK